MTRAQQVLAQLVLAEIEAGRLELRGNHFIRNGQQVVPRLSFEPNAARIAATSVPDPGVRLRTGEQNKDLGMATEFAAAQGAADQVGASRGSGPYGAFPRATTGERMARHAVRAASRAGAGPTAALGRS